MVCVFIVDATDLLGSQHKMSKLGHGKSAGTSGLTLIAEYDDIQRMHGALSVGNENSTWRIGFALLTICRQIKCSYLW